MKPIEERLGVFFYLKIFGFNRRVAINCFSRKHGMTSPCMIWSQTVHTILILLKEALFPAKGTSFTSQLTAASAQPLMPCLLMTTFSLEPSPTYSKNFTWHRQPCKFSEIAGHLSDMSLSTPQKTILMGKDVPGSVLILLDNHGAETNPTHFPPNVQVSLSTVEDSMYFALEGIRLEPGIVQHGKFLDPEESLCLRVPHFRQSRDLQTKAVCNASRRQRIDRHHWLPSPQQEHQWTLHV